MANSIAIVGIHTGIGKTIASAVIAEAIGADYWKPVQAGIEETDSAVLRRLLTDCDSRVHNEAFVLTQPLSPHAAAVIDGVVVDFTTFAWPETDRILLVETAGGVMSPISPNATMADFVQHYQLPAILVVQHYLGSINHTLLSIEVLRSRGINLLGIVISGEENEASESFIVQYGNVRIIARIPRLQTICSSEVVQCAVGIKVSLNEILS